MDRKEYNIVQVTMTHNEVTTALAGLSNLDPYECRLEVMQGEDKALSYRLTYQHEVKQATDVTEVTQ